MIGRPPKTSTGHTGGSSQAHPLSLSLSLKSSTSRHTTANNTPTIVKRRTSHSYNYHNLSPPSAFPLALGDCPTHTTTTTNYHFLNLTSDNPSTFNLQSDLPPLDESTE